MDGRPIAVIVGENVRRLRNDAGLSGDSLAREIRKLFQTRWTTARISELESGRVSPTAPTLFMVSQALGELLSRPVPVAELLSDDGYAEVGSVAIRTTRIAEAFSGEDVQLRIGDFSNSDELAGQAKAGLARAVSELRTIPGSAQNVTFDLMNKVRASSGEGDRRTAYALGIPPVHLVALSAALWGRTYTEERDRRAGPDASPQKRGRVGRELREELKRVIEHGDD